MTLLVGLATANINPPPGTPMGGYPVHEPRLTTGVHDDLLAIAMSCRDVETGDHIVLLSLDVISIPDELVKSLADQASVPVVPVASHTHSAASLSAWDQGVMGDYSPAYQNELISTCCRLVEESITAERPGYFTVGSATVATPVGANRRDPDGPRDEQVRVVEMRMANDEPMALFVIHGCHPTILGAENTLVSADLVGGLRARLSDDLGGIPVGYGPGGSGDQSTRHTRRESTFAEASRLGAVLGDAVVDARKDLRRVDGSRVEHGRLKLARRPIPSIADADIQLAFWVRELKSRRATGHSPASCRQAEVELIGAQHDARRAADPAMAKQPALDVRTARWDLGDQSIVLWPVEPTMELVNQVSVHSGAWLCGYACGYFGYLLSESDFANGGYEVAASPFTASAAHQFMATVTAAHH